MAGGTLSGSSLKMKKSRADKAFKSKDGSGPGEDGSFIKSRKFRGQRDGYVFKTGSRGVGYYRDKLEVAAAKRRMKAKAKSEARANQFKKLVKRKDLEVNDETQEQNQKQKQKQKQKPQSKSPGNDRQELQPKHKKRPRSESGASAEAEPREEERPMESSQPDEEEPQVTFSDLGVVPEISDACAALNWQFPTPVQREAIPPALTGRDMIALAETGSGKTGAFTIPLLQGLLSNQQRLYAAILAPTRELAFQIHEVVSALGQPIGCKSVCIVGGVDSMSQAISLAKKPHVIVATPGRLIDHLENTKGFNLRSLKLLVLDEADRMLSMDFEEAITKLLQVIPRDRNTYLFSATMTSKVQKLQRASLRDPVKVEVSSKYQTVKTLKQQYLFIPAKHKETYLVYVLNELAGQTSLIFTSTCAHAQKTALMLRNLGFPAICLHGQMSQPKRLGALNKFKSGSRSILIATDVASRGLDIPAVDLVINYDVPSNGKDYIHRVGRTARAGRHGRAVTLVTQYDVEVYTRIEGMLGEKLTKFPAEKETVMVMHERVFEAQRLSGIEMREKGLLGRRGRRGRGGELGDDDDDQGEGAEMRKLLDSAHKRKKKRQRR